MSSTCACVFRLQTLTALHKEAFTILPTMADFATISASAVLTAEQTEEFSSCEGSETEAAKQVLTPELISGLVKQVRGPVGRLLEQLVPARYPPKSIRRLSSQAHTPVALLFMQIEFYFSDANLPTDKKLLKQIKKDPEGFGESACDRARDSSSCRLMVLVPTWQHN